MRLARPFRVAAAGLLVVLFVVLLGLVAAHAIGGTSGLIMIVASGQMLLLGLALGAWRDQRRTLRGLRAELRAVAIEARRSETALQAATRHAGRWMRWAVERESRRLERTVTGQVKSVVEQVGTAQSRRWQNAAAQIHRALGDQFRQIEALGALYYGMQPRQAIPPTRHWAASPDLLRHLYETARHGRQRLILECGGGVSTLVLAYALRARGAGRIVTLEHHAYYAESTKELLREHGLDKWAEVRFAPLKPVALHGESWPWYELSAVPHGPIDLLLVDGPPGGTRTHARFPAMPLLHDRLAADGVVVLDDHHRKDEREITRRWLALFPDCRIETLPHEKGTAVLTRLVTDPAGRPAGGGDAG